MRATPQLLKKARTALGRRLARYASTGTGPVQLAFQLRQPPPPPAAAAAAAGTAGDESSPPPLVIMHGLFGSMKNYNSISKVLVRELARPVYTLDMRNHGSSPHTQRHDYESMAEDVEHFIRTRNLSPRTTLLGHSMGAKTAMAVALRNPDLIGSIISVDNAPTESNLHSSFGKYIRAMRHIENMHLRKQSEADAILAEVEPSLAIRQFLLTNLIRESGHLKFKIPVQTLAREVDNLGAFPFHPDKVRFEKPALFIRGTRSPYVSDETIPVIGRFFPLFRLKDIDSGHWVISEKPEEFKQAVVEFLGDTE